jgi:hypothetical protein
MDTQTSSNRANETGTSAETRALLDDLSQVRHRTRRALLATHVADHLIVWGCAWLVGFGLTAATAWSPTAIWLPVVVAGVACSVAVGQRARQVVESPDAGRIFRFFGVLAAFAVVWAALLHPFNERHLGAYVATVFMFAYVAGGLWFGRFFVILGAGVTLLALVGALVVPAWLDVLMAVGGGGALILAGLHIRRARN